MTSSTSPKKNLVKRDWEALTKVTSCILYHVHCAHCTVCTLHTAHCTLHTAHCTLCSLCTLHTAHCTPPSLQTALAKLVSRRRLEGGEFTYVYLPLEKTVAGKKVVDRHLLRETYN